MPAILDYGVLSYDIPLTQRGLYNKLRRKIRGYGIPINLSVLLIPWGARNEVQSILDEISSEKPGFLDSSIIKFDPSENRKLDQMAHDGLNDIIRNAKETMLKRLTKAEEDQATILKQIENVKISKSLDEVSIQQAETATTNTYTITCKKAVKAAEDMLANAKKLALIFNLSDRMDFAFGAMEELVRHKWELFGIKTVTGAEA